MGQEKERRRKYRKYDDAFKEEAVNQLRQGRGVKDLALSLGVSEGLLYQWKQKSSGQAKPNTDESKRLKRELKELREENEILKKALSIFSRSG